VGINASNNLLVEFGSGGAGNVRTTSIIVSGHKNWDDGEWHLVTGTINAASDDVNIYIDGAEATSYNTQDSTGPGGAFTDFPASPASLSLGQFADGLAGYFYDGSLSRPKFWQDTTLSAAQVAKEYANEVAAIGEGFGSDPVGGVGRPDFRLDQNRQTRYNRGPLRFTRR